MTKSSYYAGGFDEPTNARSALRKTITEQDRYETDLQYVEESDAKPLLRYSRSRDNQDIRITRGCPCILNQRSQHRR